MKRRSALALPLMALVGAGTTGTATATATGTGTDGVRRRGPSTRPMVALTFDDGPSEQLTPEILRILALHHVKATFFMQGAHVVQRPDLVRAVAEAGHVIGNHSYSHPDFTELTDVEADYEITHTNEVIRGITGTTPTLFRYPYGNESDAGNAVIRREQMWGGVLWHWTVNDPGDFECPGRGGVVRYINDNAVDQALILLHDGNEVLDCGSKQIAYLDQAIRKLKRRGFAFGVVAPADGPSTVNQQSWVKVVEP